jgi:O-antigen ligase
LSRPIFGGGWFYFSEYSGMGTYSHNNFLELLVTYGIVGFFTYYSMFFKVLLKLKKMYKRDNYAKLLVTMIIIILINDFAAVSFSFNILNYQVLAFGYLYFKDMQKEKKLKLMIGATVDE